MCWVRFSLNVYSSRKDDCREKKKKTKLVDDDDGGVRGECIMHPRDASLFSFKKKKKERKIFACGLYTPMRVF